MTRSVVIELVRPRNEPGLMAAYNCDSARKVDPTVPLYLHITTPLLGLAMEMH